MRRPSGFEGPEQQRARPAAKRESLARGRSASRGRDAAAARPGRAPKADAAAAGRADAGSAQAAAGAPRARRQQAGAARKQRARSRAEEHAQARAARKSERAELRRFTRGLRRRRRIVITSLLSAALLLGLLLVGIFSPLFAVRSIEVRGTERLDPARIGSALEAQLGTPLPLVQPAAIAEALAAFPQIESYVTESRLPDTLLVRIVERTPVAVIRQGAAFPVVDAAGVVLATEAERPEALPLILVGSDGVDGAGFDAAVRVLRSVPAAVFASIDELRASTLDDVSFTVRGGSQTVRWGSADESQLKAEVLAVLMSQHTDSGIEFDVSSPTMPVVG